MKFLCDVHIPLKLVKTLNNKGFEALHMKNILNGIYTKDEDISEFADRLDYIVVTKDSDFRNSFFIKGKPKKLIRVALGNISNNELIEIFNNNLIVM